MSRYIGSGQKKNGLMWGFRNWFQKLKKWALFEKNLHVILAPGLKLILPATLFHKKKIILINRSRVNDPPIIAQKQQNLRPTIDLNDYFLPLHWQFQGQINLRSYY